MNKDTHLIYEAYTTYADKKLDDQIASFKISDEEKERRNTIPSKQDIGNAISKFKADGFLTPEEVLHNIHLAKQQIEEDNIDTTLLDFLRDSLMDIEENYYGRALAPKASEFNIADAAVSYLKTYRDWSKNGKRYIQADRMKSEDAEEGRELTMDNIIQAIEKNLKPSRRDASVSFCYLGEVYNQLEKMGFKMYGQYGENTPKDQFEKLWDNNNEIEKDRNCFLGQNAYSYDPNCGKDYDYSRPYEKPSFDKYGNGPYLFMEGSEDGPDVWTACEFAKKHGYKKVILNGLS